MSTHYVLKIQYVNKPPETRNIGARVTTIGREAGDIVLGDPQSSGRHAEIHFENGNVRVKDLGSTNGTYFNGARTPEFTLMPGQGFSIGQTIMTLMAVNTAQARPGGGKTMIAMGGLPPRPPGPGGPPPGAPPPGPGGFGAPPPPGPPGGAPPPAGGFGAPPPGAPPPGGPPPGGAAPGGYGAPPPGGAPMGPPGAPPPGGAAPMGAPAPAPAPMGGAPMGGAPMGGPAPGAGAMAPAPNPYAAPAAMGGPSMGGGGGGAGLEPVANPLDIGETVGAGWEVFKNNAAAMIVGLLAVGVVGGFTLGICMGPMLIGYMRMALRAARGETVAIGDVFGGFDKFLPSLGLFFLVAIGVFVGMMLLVIPGIIFAFLAYWSFWIMADSELSAIDCIKKSVELVREDIGGTLVFMIVSSLINAAGNFVPFGSLITGPIAIGMGASGFERLTRGRQL